MTQTLPTKLHKIGAAATLVGISVPTLRMYEQEGLLIPIKSNGGTRYYDDDDIRWIKCIRRMITELGLNLEGIRRLLALIPCWEFRDCQEGCEGKCEVAKESTQPCWIVRSQQGLVELKDCHDCPTFRYSINCENLKSLFQIRLKQLAEMTAKNS
jgi:MerR family transcriptional regulator/heat shock protein HspR